MVGFIDGEFNGGFLGGSWSSVISRSSGVICGVGRVSGLYSNVTLKSLIILKSYFSILIKNVGKGGLFLIKAIFS